MIYLHHKTLIEYNLRCTGFNQAVDFDSTKAGTHLKRKNRHERL